ncbi:hypothetical protein O6H91_15G019800 [Diphasiastrum complanatum]|uniref:Uncharacterized protein n=1 Tax=Diphasiastrum complanatum TaxID=34168 RepID=A0ACC2BGF9_DIPCM|nr:hypothetical protein O6H91_15G019800 [Diphasiastrum complanatum]
MGANSEVGSPLKSAALLEQMKAHLESDAGKDLQEKIGLVYEIKIAPKKIGIDEETFVVDLKNSKVLKGKAEGKPDASFSFVDGDFLAVATGKMNPQMAFIRQDEDKGEYECCSKVHSRHLPKTFEAVNKNFHHYVVRP